MKTPTEKDPNRALKWVVISMGMLLIGGTILLFILVFKKMAHQMPDAQNAMIPRAYRECGEHTLKLPKGTTIESVKYEGTIARILARNAAGETMIVLADSCSGKKLGELHITTQ